MSSNITVVFRGPEPSNILKSIVLPLNAETISVTNSLEQLQKQVNDYLTECIQSTQSNNVQGLEQEDEELSSDSDEDSGNNLCGKPNKLPKLS